ncbi:MAG TPA: PQQ-binding-like beta-propeller repeat protein [Candidatus Acidoferrales bacterium]|nr:PQQ-binding-like beta-propeller repeat protein [Candidatus Acidoferrales bacterium]
MKQFRCIGALLIACVLAVLATAHPALAQNPSPIPASPGETVFGQHCASCHVGPSRTDRAPDLKTLMELTPESVFAAITTGSMIVPAQKLTDDEKKFVSEYLGGRPLDTKHTGSAESMSNRCSSNPPVENPSAGPSWNGWSAGPGNARFASAQIAGFSAEQIPQLKLKWAFGFPNGDTAFGQPTVVGGRIYVGSDIGYVYSLDAVTGCVYWSFHARSGVRTAPSVGPVKGAGAAKYAVYFGDMRANAYAVDASTGEQIWVQKLSDHYTARITGAPALHAGRLYVPISATEEVFSANPSYPCCTFRGSVVALDANTGQQIWRSYVIPEEPRPTRKNSADVQLMGPAGAAVWNSPTVDARRGVLYVGTGDAFTEPAAKTSDAVVALELKTGKILWSFQAEQNDAWMVGCVPVRTENCPKELGTDHDFGSSPVLITLSNGRQILLATPKSGTISALDPDHKGDVLWQLSLSERTAPNNGQIAFGGSTDSEKIYLALEDGTFVAVDLATGKRSWITRLQSPDDLGQPTANGENRTKAGLRFGQSAAVTGIPGAVFTGGWDGILRALSTADGRILWQFNTVQDFKTVNGVTAKGGSMGAPGPTVVNGMLYLGSGYANVGGGMPGNVLLAFSAK